ncbi:FCGR1 protein, partial [Atractosteus spatula]|nr:FCGR1 protein [Atractosteus spatula]
MDLLLSLLVVSAVAPSVVLQDRPGSAVLHLSAGAPEVFIGETVTLTCHVPGEPSGWTFVWYKDGAPVQQLGTVGGGRYTLRPTLPHHGGQYSCQGLRAWPWPQRSLPSEPVSIRVTGGWVILQTPPQPLLRGAGATLTCRVRGNPRLQQVVFYKDRRVLASQSGPQLHLASLSHRDEGLYGCRATWGKRWGWKTAESPEVGVSVRDLLTEPVMEVLTETPVQRGQDLVLRCRAQLTSHGPGLRLRYSFRRGGQRLGVASSQDTHVVRSAAARHSGRYWCRATVDGLGLGKSSEKVLVWVIEDEESELESSRPSRPEHPTDPPQAQNSPSSSQSPSPEASPSSFWNLTESSAWEAMTPGNTTL